MGFFFRKSLRFGPIRFNLSSSGIGVSSGVRGLRFGAGPRGSYINAGAHGIYYRKTISSVAKPHGGAGVAPRRDVPSPISPSSGSHGPMVPVSTASPTELANDSAAGLLQDLQQRQARISFGPWTIFFTLALAVSLALKGAEPLLVGLLLVVGILATLLAAAIDRQRKTVVLFYDLDQEFCDRYQRFYESVLNLRNCAKLWVITAKADVYDPKYQAGADALVQRDSAVIHEGAPHGIKTNVAALTLRYGSRSLVFLPHCILIFDGKAIGTVAYDNVKIKAYNTRFIESSGVPRDSEIVDYTWQYTNRNGGPDRRFNNNRKIPVAAYEEIAFSNGHGFRQVIQASRIGHGKGIWNAVSSLSELTGLGATDEKQTASSIPSQDGGRWETFPILAAFICISGLALIAFKSIRPAVQPMPRTKAMHAPDDKRSSTQSPTPIIERPLKSPAVAHTIKNLSASGLANALSLAKRGFQLEITQVNTISVWTWKLAMPGKTYVVVISGESDVAIASIKASLALKESEGGETFAKTFLVQVAALGSTSDQAKKAQDWVAANVSQGGKIAVGKLDLNLQAAPNAEWDLEIQATP